MALLITVVLITDLKQFKSSQHGMLIIGEVSTVAMIVVTWKLSTQT